MNILEQTEALKDMPDAALIQQMKMPTGQIAPIFITSELKRRKRMRDDYARREAADTPTVAEEVVMAAGMPQGGIADAARALAPKTDMGQNTGMGDMMPRTATQAPQPMASGGIVGMRQGGKLVKVGRASFYAFPDGEVFFEAPDGSREAVTDPRVLGVVREQANVGPERQDESAAPLGSEVLQEAAPERPTLDSTLSSARPFSPTSTEATDTRPAVPSSLGMGGERPTIVTSPAQPSFSPELDGQGIASIATSSTGVDPFGAAQSLLPPPETDVLSMVAPPTGESAVSTAGTDKLESAIAAAQSAINIDKTTPITLTMQQVQQAIAEGNSDILELAQQQGLLDEAIATMPAARSPEDRALAKFMESQKMTSGRPGGTTIEDTRMMNMLNAQRQAEEAANLEASRKTQPNVDVGTDPKFGDTMGLQEVLAGDFDPVSDASSKPAFIPSKENFAAIAREDPLDLPTRSTSLTPLQSIGGQDNVEVAASANPLPVTDSGANPFADAYESFQDSIEQAEALRNAAKVPPLKQILVEQELAEVARQDPFDVPQDVAPVADTTTPTTTPTTPDAGGITTVSTKAINDAAKQPKGLSTDAWLAIAQGGAAMAASKNPTLLGAFGEGAGVAAAGLQKQRAAEKTAGLAQAKIDATLEAARIRAAASMAGRARPQVTETALFTELSKELRDKEFLLNSAGDNLAPAVRDSLTTRIEEIKERLARVERGESLIGPVAGGTDDVKKISLP
jgi:hypothetical protein